MDAKPGTPEFDELEALVILVEAFERIAYPMEAAPANDAVLFYMDQHNLKPKDLVPIFGSTSRTSDILSGKKPMTLEMIRKLNSQYGISIESLTRPSRLREPARRGRPAAA